MSWASRMKAELHSRRPAELHSRRPVTEGNQFWTWVTTSNDFLHCLVSPLSETAAYGLSYLVSASSFQLYVVRSSPSYIPGTELKVLQGLAILGATMTSATRCCAVSCGFLEVK